MSTQRKQIYEFGPFRLVPAEQQLFRNGGSVPLTPKSFDLLVALVEDAGHLLEKGELLNRVWPDSFVEEANLSVKMSELRRALGEGPNSNQYIETVPRRGYRFVAHVTKPAGASAPNSVLVDSDEIIGNDDVVAKTRPSPRTIVRDPKWRAAAIAIAVVIVGSLLVGLNAGGLRERLLSTAAPTQIRSLAVLPLEDLSGDTSQDYFTDGFTEMLITDLAKISDLRVISRSSVMQFKESRQSPSEIGRELNVDALLTGSVVRAGERVQVSVQLIDAASDHKLWSERYERDLRDVLSLQGEIARDIGRRIRVELTPQEQLRFASHTPVDPVAYDHYLRGKFHLHRQNREANEAAIAALENSVSIDPAFAAAQAELAQAYVWKLFLFDPKEERKWAEKAFLASEKALSLDPNLAVAYLARGRLLWTPANRFPHHKAIQEYHRALALDPSLDEARNQLALVYCHIGAFDEALIESQRAIATNPTNNLAQLRIGQTLNFQGKHTEALEVLSKLPQEVNPALVGHQSAWALVNLGRVEEASAMIDQLLQKFPEDTGGVLTSIQAVLAASRGDRRLAQEKINEAVEKGSGFGHFHHTAYHIACAYARLDRHAEAIRWLKAAADDGFPCFPLFERDPNLDNLRSDPRFADFLTGLRQQWEAHSTVVGR